MSVKFRMGVGKRGADRSDERTDAKPADYGAVVYGSCLGFRM